MQMQPFGWDVFLRRTDPNGRKNVDQIRSWDPPRTIAAQQAHAAKVNADQAANDLPAKASVEQITEEQYRNERRTPA